MMGRRDKKDKSANDEKLLEIDASMQGTLSFKDPVNIVINGNFEGNLDTMGTLTIGEAATVKAKINGEAIICKGEIVGDVSATKSLSLHEKARLIGDVQTPMLSMESGGVIQGQISMMTLQGKGTNRTKSSLFSAEELATYLSVEKSLIFEWADQGKLPGTRDGSTWSFDKKKVDEWVASGMIK